MADISSLALWKLISQHEPELDSCEEELSHVEKIVKRGVSSKPAMKLLQSAAKTFRKQKRGSSSQQTKDGWHDLGARTDKLLTELTENPTPTGNDAVQAEEDDGVGLPKSASTYLARLKKQSKDVYKNPPALPPPKATLEEDMSPLPTRSKTGALMFVAGKDKEVAKLLQYFHPNRTPEQILRGGAFGGTYFRPIVSAVTNQRYKSSDVLNDTVAPEWISGLDKKSMLTSSTYNQHINRFQAKCGGSLGMWESSGWISNIDPYGWFQWYCRFYQGRRSSDDARQISRSLGVAGPKGRFRSQLCNKILAANTSADDHSISPVIRQTLFHWGLEVTEAILEEHRKRKR